MRNVLTSSEASLYTTLWGSVSHYAENSPGAECVPLFLDMAKPFPEDRILDAGCGSGKTAIALREQGFTSIELCDLTDEGLVEAARRFPFTRCSVWEDLYDQFGPVDWVYCADVMEHLDTAFVMLTVYRLLDVATKGVFLTVGLTTDVYGAWVGRPLHQTVQSFVWWRDHLRELAVLVEGRDLITQGVFLIRKERPC